MLQALGIRTRSEIMSLEHQLQPHQQENGVVTLSCLYTKQKSQKRKVWHDGQIVVNHRTCCIRLVDATTESSTRLTIPLTSVLDQIELSKQQIEQILSPTSHHQPTMEFENYLVSSWEPNSTASAVSYKRSSTISSSTSISSSSSKTTTTSGMKKLLSTKFRPPTCSNYKPPSRENALPRKRPLQPGELEQRYCSNIFNNSECSNDFQRKPRYDSHPINKENWRQNSASSTNYDPSHHVSYPPDGSNDQEEGRSTSTSHTWTKPYQVVNFCNDAPQFDPVQYYGEEDMSDPDESTDGSEQQPCLRQNYVADVPYSTRNQSSQCVPSSNSIPRSKFDTTQLPLPYPALLGHTHSAIGTHTTLSRSDLLKLLDASINSNNSLEGTSLPNYSLGATNSNEIIISTARSSPSEVQDDRTEENNSDSCVKLTRGKQKLSEVMAIESSRSTTMDEIQGKSETIFSLLMEADSALDDETQDNPELVEANLVSKTTGDDDVKIQFSLPAIDSSSSYDDNDDDGSNSLNVQ